MDECFVTGATGFIGAVLCRRLESGGALVRRISRAAYSNGVRDALPASGESGTKAVFHLAARVHAFDRGPSDDAEHSRVTVDGTSALLHAASEAGCRVFVFFSSCAVMPEGCDEILDETTTPAPTTAYGRAKLSAEGLVLGMNGKNGMATVCIRMPTVYGPGHKGSLPRMISAIERGIFPPLPDFQSRRSLVHVQDAVEAAILASQNPVAAGRIYIVAEPQAYSSREIYELVIRALGRHVPRWHVPRALLAMAAKGGDYIEKMTHRRAPFDSEMLAKLSRPATYSADRIRRELGFQPSRMFDTAVPELLTDPQR